MSAPLRGDLIDTLMLVQGACNLVLQREDGGDHELAECIIGIIKGNVTVTEAGLPPT